jgi:hypothetical protein
VGIEHGGDAILSAWGCSYSTHAFKKNSKTKISGGVVVVVCANMLVCVLVLSYEDELLSLASN